MASTMFDFRIRSGDDRRDPGEKSNVVLS